MLFLRPFLHTAIKNHYSLQLKWLSYSYQVLSLARCCTLLRSKIAVPRQKTGSLAIEQPLSWVVYPPPPCKPMIQLTKVAVFVEEPIQRGRWTNRQSQIIGIHKRSLVNFPDKGVS